MPDWARKIPVTSQPFNAILPHGIIQRALHLRKIVDEVGGEYVRLIVTGFAPVLAHVERVDDVIGVVVQQVHGARTGVVEVDGQVVGEAAAHADHQRVVA